MNAYAPPPSVVSGWRRPFPVKAAMVPPPSAVGGWEETLTETEVGGTRPSLAQEHDLPETDRRPILPWLAQSLAWGVFYALVLLLVLMSAIFWTNLSAPR